MSPLVVQEPIFKSFCSVKPDEPIKKQGKLPRDL
jgi:hypothetical protein